MPSGDGRSTAKGLKCEWMTVKDEVLFLGSIGKEYIRGGEIVSYDNTWIKTLDRVGGIHHIDWKIIYDKLRSATGTEYPGYLVHEAVGWSEQMRKWVFLPRRASKEAYDEKLDERKGANLALIVDEDFSNVKQITIGPDNPSHGFSSFKFVPFRENEIVALKSVEDGDTIKSFMTVFDLKTGEILMEETEVSSSTKFEGVEFL
jgi:soluble calcium-activated nucleotidase 1